MPALRLGDLLVEAGAITGVQLTEALGHQRQYGGRLGTNLVELGFIDERTLAGVLARQLNIPSATAAQLDRADPRALGLLSPAAADKLRAVPIREDQGKLWVAMADPTDQMALAEVGKLTKRPVRPMVAPELLIQYALERHYRVPRKPRVMQVRTGSTGLIQFDGARMPTVPAAPLPVGVAPPLPPPPPAAPPPVYNPYGGDGQTAELDDFANFLDVPAPGSQAPARPPRQSLQDLSIELAAAPNDEAIFTLAMRYLAPDVRRIGVFVLKGGLLVGWRGVGVDNAALKRVSVALADAAVAARTLSSGEAWVGRLHQRDLGDLGGPLGVQKETLAVVLPVRIGKRAVGLIVGVEATLEALRQKADIDKLVIKLDQALHISHLRRLLLQTN